MANGNEVSLTGNTTRDAELRFTPGGTAVAQFGLAVNRVRFDRNTNEKTEEVSFFDIVSFGSLAENVAETLTRGSRVLVQGRLEQRNWETPEGEKRSKIEVVADEIGPSLRWATAEILKNERPSGNQPPLEEYDEQPAQPAQRPARPAQRQASQQQRGARDATPQASGFQRPVPNEPQYDYDSEEPF